MLKVVHPEKREKLTLSDAKAEGALVAAACRGMTFDVSPDDFSDPVWSRAYRFARQAREAGERISPEILKLRLGIPPEKAPFLRVPTPEEAEVCARIVREKSILRKLRDCMRELYSGGDVKSCLDRAQDLINSYRSIGSKSVVRAGDILEESLKEMEWGILYGFGQIDAWTRGMHRGDLIILAGRPSVGKTTLAVQIAAKVSLSGRVAFFSLEMKAPQIVRKAACSLSGIPAEKIFWDEAVREKIEKMNFYVCDDPSQTPGTLHETCARLKGAGLDLVVVDYLQLLRPGRKCESREQEISEISRSLKLLARDLDVPVLALSQLSRDIEKRRGRPKLSDLRGSGSLEQDADAVFFIHKEKRTELILEKQRNGPTGIVEVEFHKEISRFEEIGEVEE